MRKELLVLLGIGFSFMAISQASNPIIKRGTLALQAGAYDFKTAQAIRSTSLTNVLSNNEWAGIKEMDIAFGLSYIKGITSYLDYSVNGYFGFVKYPVRTNTGTKTGPSKLLSEVDASLQLKLLPDNYIVSPYLSAGVGGSSNNGHFEAFSPLGVGLQVKLAPESFLFSNFQYRVPVTQGANYHFLYTIGFGTPVGKERTPEVKEVPPAPVVVPEAPKDTDGDGIADPEDKCPTVPGVAKYQGCPVPDTDNDGIKDDVDKCPTVPGVAQYEGCPVPDTDNDGIKDDVDKCPTVAGVAKYEGCPVPDTDGDGFNDEEDKCPTVAGIKELFGCPRPDFKSENVLFATGKAVLVATGKKELDIIADYLKTYTGFNVLVEGHTDNTGDEKLNQKLSEARAESAKKYLVSQGVDGSRLSTVGYGESMPIADNKTAEGKKKNRRVQFKIVE